MDCSELTTPQNWDSEPRSKVAEYRKHLQHCTQCRQVVLREAPDQLLFEMQGDPMPDEFWIGFWPSIEHKISGAGVPARRGHGYPRHENLSPVRLMRWAAVFVVGVMLALYSKTFSQVAPNPNILRAGGVVVRSYPPDSYRYPLVEAVQNPKATYYIFQPEGNEKVIMVFDPDMEL